MDKQYYNLTQPQMGILYLEEMYKGLPINNIGGYRILKGKINIQILEKAIQIFIKKNDAIRMQITKKDGNVVQYIKKFEKKEIEFIDFSKQEDPEKSLRKWVDIKSKMNFVIEDNDLYYIAMFKLSDDKNGFYVKFNHIIFDGWSIEIMDREIGRIYTKLINNEDVFEEVENSYISLIEDEEKYLSSKRMKKNKKFWIDKYSDVSKEMVELNSLSTEGTRKEYKITGEIVNKIKEILNGNSLNVFFICLYSIYMNRNSNKNEFVIGTPVFNRSGSKFKNTVGMYTSTMPFRLKINESNNFFEAMKNIRDEMFKCYLNQKYPYNFLVNDLELKKKDINGLYNVCINYYNTQLRGGIENVEVESYEIYNGHQNYALQIIIKEWSVNDEITLTFDYKNEIYDNEEINNIYNGFITIIDQIVKNPYISINKIEMISSDIRKELIDSFNKTEYIYPKNKGICTLFEEQVLKTPNSIAISDGKEALTYKELNKKSNQLARLLCKYDINKNEIVGILNYNSIDTVICILAILKAGGAYLPIDVTYPSNRIDLMLQECNVSKLFVNNDKYKELKYMNIIIDCRDNIYVGEDENLGIVKNGDDLAYVIFTSGSTGKPKGVMIKERGLVNYICWCKMYYLEKEKEIFPLYSSIAFDLTVTSIFVPLISGGEIAVYYEKENKASIIDILEDNRCTIVKLTPAHLDLIKTLNISNTSIYKFIVGGEELKSKLAEEITTIFNDNISIYNEYGPTETVVGCMIHKYEKREKGNSVPIGKPINNTKIYILNESLNPVNIGQIGEIYISGDGVSKGYINRNELNKKTFIDNPFVKGLKMYKTGDLAKFNSSGNVEYVGRKDYQVKIRGYRIEIGEIEEKINSISQIINSVVIVKNYNGSKQLCAYIVKKAEITTGQIREYLKQFLPEYMIPIEFIEVDDIPINNNGKVDRKKLSQINEKIDTNEQYEEMNDEEKNRILEVIKDILDVNNITYKDNYYHLGGDSIKAIQISTKLESLGYKIAVSEILVEPVIGHIISNVKKSKEIQKTNNNSEEGIIETTPIISWFVNQKLYEPNFYNQSVIITTNKNYAVNEIEEVINKIISYHDSLRININDGKLFYNKKYLENEFTADYFDISNMSQNDQEKYIRKLQNKNYFEECSDEILFKVFIFKVSSTKKKILLIAHHLIIDGVSWRIIIEDLFTGLECIKNNKSIKFISKTDSLKKWSNIIKRYEKDLFDKEKEYWSNIVNNEQVIRTDFEYIEDTYENVKALYGVVDKDKTSKLLTIANKTYNTKTKELIIYSLAKTINEINNNDNIMIIVESYGRNEIFHDVNVDRTVGWFTSIYPINLNLSDNDINMQIKKTKDYLRSIPNGGIGFGVLNRKNCFNNYNEKKQVRFNFLGDISSYESNNNFEIENSSINLFTSKKNKVNYLLDINCIVINGELEIKIEYSKNLFLEKTIKKFLNMFINNINKTVDYCINKDCIEFTTSDFDLVDLSYEELDTLFK